MYRLTTEKRTAVLNALVEGNSVRATCRLTGAAKGTVLRLLAELGEVCRALHDERVRNIAAKRVQCDETWSFVGMKEKNVPKDQRGSPRVGDVWTWVALDADTKLAISWEVGNRGFSVYPFIADLASRLANRVQLTTDGHSVYLRAIEETFGWNGVDYAMLVKKYAGSFGQGYSPPRCIGAEKSWVMGSPVFEDVCTSHVERSNLTMRMQMRRFTRLTNAFSKKVENHAHAIALHFVAYNWCRPHGTLTKKARGIHTTPAMAAGLTNRVWTLADLVSLLEAKERDAKRLAS